ncbi:MAG: prepilin-type N-terminal cleavage/methylation domain-containing protein [Kiritimatiellia bacterium]
MKNNLRKAFTLIELMVVITIIGILVAILLPVIGAVFTSGEKAQARTEIIGLVAAINKYYDDYGKFPSELGEPTGGIAASANLVKLLGGEDAGGENPRKRIYMEFQARSIASGELRDPWDKAYRVSVDKNLDGICGAPGSTVRRRVIVWSGGPDLDHMSGTDNVSSW